jgi:hypothetical protein
VADWPLRKKPAGVRWAANSTILTNAQGSGHPEAVTRVPVLDATRTSSISFVKRTACSKPGTVRLPSVKVRASISHEPAKTRVFIQWLLDAFAEPPWRHAEE